MASSYRSTRRIFISHTHKDDDFGIRLVEDLRRVIGDNSAVWYDSQGGLKGGDVWWPKIAKEIKQRSIFIVIFSPDAVNSRWVEKEIDVAWKDHVEEGTKFISIMYRQCDIPSYLQTVQVVSFLQPKTYESAFSELITALKLNQRIKGNEAINPINSIKPPDYVRHAMQRIKKAFDQADWSYVIERTNTLISQHPDSITPYLYYMQGSAFLFKNQPYQAQDILEKGLTLAKDTDEHLSLLDVYTAPFISNNQWNDVLIPVEQALQLKPEHPIWQWVKEEAQKRVSQNGHISSSKLEIHIPIKISEAEMKNKDAHINFDKRQDIQAIVSSKNTHHKIEATGIPRYEQKMTDIEIQKQQLSLQKERFFFEKEVMTFAFEMAEKVANLSTDADKNAKARLIRTFLSKFLQLEN